MRKDRTWAILAALALVVAVSYYLLEVRGIAQQPEDVEYVWDLEAEQIVGIRVTDHISGTATALEKDSAGTWRVTEPMSEMAEAADCASLAYTLARMQIRRTIEEPPEEELGTYGLITPTYTIELQVDEGQPLRLEVGAHYPAGAYYARREGEQEVILVQDYAMNDVIRIIEHPPVAEPTPGVPVAGPSAEEP